MGWCCAADDAQAANAARLPAEGGSSAYTWGRKSIDWAVSQKQTCTLCLDRPGLHASQREEHSKIGNGTVNHALLLE
jgi:hypothetical protein